MEAAAGCVGTAAADEVEASFLGPDEAAAGLP